MTEKIPLFDDDDLTEEAKEKLETMFSNAVDVRVQQTLREEFEMIVDNLTYLEGRHDGLAKDVSSLESRMELMAEWAEEEIGNTLAARLEKLKGYHEQLRQAMFSLADELNPEARERFYQKVGKLARDSSTSRYSGDNWDGGIEPKQAAANRESIKASAHFETGKPQFAAGLKKSNLDLKEGLSTETKVDRYAQALSELVRKARANPLS
jgi:hypothetical protein